MKLLIEIAENNYKEMCEHGIERVDFDIQRMMKNATIIPDNATRAQVFEKIFGMKIDTTGDCGFFDCSDIFCHDCQIGQITPLEDAYKIWWDAQYKGGE